MLADILLPRLAGVIRSGEGKWSARCPAHEDRSPSLSVRDTGERLLIHCFSGCSPDDILAAVGLSWRQMYPDSWTCAARRPHEAAYRALRKVSASIDPLEIERSVLRIAAEELRAGKTLSVEDRARVEVARIRIGRSLTAVKGAMSHGTS